MNLFTRDFYTPPTVIYCKHQRNQELITEWNKILNISKEYLDKIK